MIAIKDTIDFQLLDVVLNPEGRFIILVCTINRAAYSIINVYAPNSYEMKFLLTLHTYFLDLYAPSNPQSSVVTSTWYQTYLWTPPHQKKDVIHL